MTINVRLDPISEKRFVWLMQQDPKRSISNTVKDCIFAYTLMEVKRMHIMDEGLLFDLYIPSSVVKGGE